MALCYFTYVLQASMLTKLMGGEQSGNLSRDHHQGGGVVNCAHFSFQSCDHCGSECVMGEQQKDHRYGCKDSITFADPGPSNFFVVHIPLLYKSQQNGFSLSIY